MSDTRRVKKGMKAILDYFSFNPETSSNVTILREIKIRSFSDITDEEYQEAKRLLKEDGCIEIGKGQGGTVKSIKFPDGYKKPRQAIQATPEHALYERIANSLEVYYLNLGQLRTGHYVRNVAPDQGSRDTGGLWTRPDFSLIAVDNHDYYPGKQMKVTTFEIKNARNRGISGVFETASHSVFAHESYLVIELEASDFRGAVERSNLDADAFARHIRLCDHFGIGLIAFTNPSDISSFIFLCKPKFHEPDPVEVNFLIEKQFDDEKRRIIRGLIS